MRQDSETNIIVLNTALKRGKVTKSRKRIVSEQWLKWFCEAGRLTWRSQVGASPIPIQTPLRHKITLYRFNQGAHTIAGGSNGSRGWAPPYPLTLTTDYDIISQINSLNTVYICGGSRDIAKRQCYVIVTSRWRTVRKKSERQKKNT